MIKSGAILSRIRNMSAEIKKEIEPSRAAYPA